MVFLQYGIRLGRLLDQHSQRWEVGVPFNQCRRWVKVMDRLLIEASDFWINGLTVGIEQHASEAIEAGQVDLLHSLSWNCAQKLEGVQTKVHGIDIDVV